MYFTKLNDVFLFSILYKYECEYGYDYEYEYEYDCGYEYGGNSLHDENDYDMVEDECSVCVIVEIRVIMLKLKSMLMSM